MEIGSLNYVPSIVTIFTAVKYYVDEILSGLEMR